MGCTVENKERLTTGKFAEINGISRKTLRLWRDMGVLEPAVVDEENGYAYYSFDQCGAVDAVLQLQKCGLSLLQIKDLAKNNYAGIKGSLAERRQAIDRELLELTATRRTIDDLLESFRWWHANPIFDEPIVERLPEQPIIAYPILYPPAARMSHQIGSFLDDAEVNLRLLKKHVLQQGIPLSLFCNVGDQITQENVLAGRYDIERSILFVKDALIADAFANDTLPAGTYLTMYRRSIDVEGENVEVKGIEELLAYARTHRMRICGDYYGQVIGETPLYHFNGRGMAVKLLLPVCADLQGSDFEHMQGAEEAPIFE